MHYVYGPIPSRRLGRSLGVDPIPLKTCNWNCVYCQLGRSRPVTHVRQEYVPREAILADLRHALATIPAAEIDWVTFVGSGEPTLHSAIGWLIRQTQFLTDHPIAVITNGSLLYLPEVREALLPAAAVMPSLDAGTPELYKKVNRPHPAASLERLVTGLKRFRQEYTGRFWLEIMLVSGLNDTDEALRDIAAVLSEIRPDQVHLNLPIRPPAEEWVRPPDEEGLMRAMAILGENATVLSPAAIALDLSRCDSALEAVVDIVTRHPLPDTDLRRALEPWPAAEVDAALEHLEEEGLVQEVERYGTRFWCGTDSFFHG